MNNSFVVVGFDLAWAGDIGWCRLLHDGMGYTDYETGTISPSGIDKRTKKKLATRPSIRTGEVAECFRALGIAERIGNVLYESEDGGATPVFIVYESSLTWLLGASKQYRKKKPVTRKGIMTSAFSVCAFWAGVGKWLTETIATQVDIQPADTRSARARFGVDDLPLGITDRITELAATAGYADRDKALIGLAAEVRLRSEPGLSRLIAIPPTDHEADAAVFAFVRGDEIAMEMRARNGRWCG